MTARNLGTYLQQEGLLRAQGDPAEYRKLRNNFLANVICRKGQQALPLTLAILYCAIAVRLGLSASPCNYPRHVYVVVDVGDRCDTSEELELISGDQSSERECFGNRVFLDPYDISQFVPELALRRQLHALGQSFTEDDEDEFLKPLDERGVVLRCARNIGQSIRWHHEHHLIEDSEFSPDPSPFDPETDNVEGDPCLQLTKARYAALWATLVCGNGLAVRPVAEICQSVEFEFPCDAGLLESRFLLPGTSPEEITDLASTIARIRSRDSLKIASKARSTLALSSSVSFKVGQVVRHRRYHYQGAIYGWDSRCEMSDVWKAQMNIASLPRGSNQSFYHVL